MKNYDEMTQEELLANIDNKNHVVRDGVARRIDPAYLPRMMNDENANVRYRVAQRIDSSYLPQMTNDEDWGVRHWVARQIDPVYLLQMVNDKDKIVRETVYSRIPRELVPPECLAEFDEFHVNKVIES